MAPKPTGAALLFHPKKKRPGVPPKKESDDSRSPSPSKPRTAAPPRPPKPRESDDDLKPPPPEGPYSEFRLMSSALNGWKYDVMKFDSRKPVDITTWPIPVKLNRKEPRRELDDGVAGVVPQAVGPMLGPDGKPVIGVDGKIVLVDAEGRPIRPGETYANGSGSDKGKEKDKAAQAKKRFQKKTKQVFMVPEATRQLRKEERFPWVMEDGTGKEVWVGKMEEVAKSETHAMFMPAANDVFKFVPAHRWYKFQKRPSYRVPTLEEAESLMTKIQKNKDPERWLLRRRNGQGASEATAAMFKQERSGSLGPITASASLGPGGRRLKTVDSGGGGLFGDDDEDGVGRKRRMERELGAEGDVDELDFEEAFQDDEEKMEPDDRDDEEAKELEERLKREYKTANKMREGYIDESDEEEETTLTKAGRTLQKTLQKLEKDGGYESDEEGNPYASEVEEEEEPIPVQTGPAIIPPEPRPGRSPQPPASSVPTSTANGTKTPTASHPLPQIKVEPNVESLSRPTSPIAGHGGHFVVAKRATSPKMPKVKPSASRAASPLAGRVTSPTASRATSPVAGMGAGAGSPIASPQSPTSPPLANGSAGGAKPSNKRKATEDAQGAGAAKPKKRKAHGPPGGVELRDEMVIEWLRTTPGATTRDCIHHFTPWLTDEAKKMRFTALVKEVAQLSKGVLVLRPAYRDVGAAPPAMAVGAPTS